jgi:hypothetical protein
VGESVFTERRNEVKRRRSKLADQGLPGQQILSKHGTSFGRGGRRKKERKSQRQVDGCTYLAQVA